MSAIHQDQSSSPEDTSNLLLVDRLWKLKKACEKKLFLYIQLNRLIKDIDYRHNLIGQARALNDDKINQLILDILEAEKLSKHDDKLAGIDGSTAPVLSAPDNFQLNRSRRFRLNQLFTPLVLLVMILVIAGVGYTFMRENSRLVEQNRVLIDSAKNNNGGGHSDQVRQVANTSAALTLGVSIDQNPLPNMGITPFLRIHGSNSVGEKLLPALMDAFLAQRRVAQTKWLQGAVPVERQLQYLGAGGKALAIELHAHGTSTGFRALLENQADIAMASRAIKDSEWNQLLPIYGDLRSKLSEHIVGLDGLAIVTYPGNPIDKLTVKQLADIFSGKITNWQALGGQNRSIALFARDENSGTWDTFKSLVLKPFKESLATNALRFESSSELSDLVSKTKGGIGFIALPYVRDTKLLAVAATEDSLPIVPTRFTISTEDYPLSRRLYVYTPADSPEPMVKAFVNFALSQPGQAVVEDLGLASQNIKLQSPPVLASAPQEYQELIGKAQRLSLNFRFNTASDKLDNKALRDLERLVEFMSKHSDRSLLLFGFSDSVGDTSNNYLLSLKRAKVVELALHSRGIAPYRVVGLGESLPLASNDTQQGREKNRRVEVWLM